jgi:hypothetical protein
MILISVYSNQQVRLIPVSKLAVSVIVIRVFNVIIDLLVILVVVILWVI